MLKQQKVETEQGLKATDVSEARQELGLVDPGAITLDETPDPALEKMAEHKVSG